MWDRAKEYLFVGFIAITLAFAAVLTGILMSMIIIVSAQILVGMKIG